MEIGLSILILWCFIFTIIGAVLMLLLQYYIYVKFSLLPEPTAEQNAYNAKYSLPAALNATARNFQKKSSATSTTTTTLTTAVNASTNAHNNETDTTSLLALNFVMQFLFHELKNSNRVRKWFYRKLSLELDELIAKTTTGKLFDKLTIKQLELGDQFPEIKTLKVHNIELDDAVGRIENLDLLMELRYNGNFRTSIDADMVLGKKGSLTLKVKQLSGVARLQFTRNPYTHWSLSFLGDPELDLDIESKYQGRQMQANITSLISNQIRKAIRRKHTLPNYKIRYKPFFHKTSEEDAGEGDIQPNGMLEVKVSEISRLMCPQHLVDIYCTLTMASVAFVESRQHDDRHVLVSLDVEIHKAKNQQIGIIFKQASVDTVEIEAILPNTPAFKSNLKLGDTLLAIEGKRVATIQQVAKAIKNVQSNILKLRIDRVIPGIIRNDAILEDLDLYEDLGDNRTGYGSSTNNSAAKAHDLEVNVKQTALRTSTSIAEKGASSESSLCSTPTNSPKKTKLITKALKKTISRDFGDDGFKAKSKSPIKLINSPKNTAKVLVETLINATSVNDVEHFFQHSTIDCKLAPMISMEDLSQFKLDANCRYLNICVYGKCGGENQLLAFTNISINHILMECSETSLSHSFRICELSPPIPQDLKTHFLSAQSGFNPNLCFGDLLLTFTWDGNPNISMNADFSSKPVSRVKAKSVTSLDKTDDSGYSDTISLKSVDTLSMYSRSHNFVRTHFQRATQCDFCGKKIWLKDAVQCRDCYMCCHKKCINKCQNATVCGPVDCSATAPTTIITTTPAPEFMVTEPESPIRTHKADLPINTSIESSILEETKSGSSPLLEVQRSSFAGILNQSMKRVNSVNNLAIPSLGVINPSGGGGNKGELPRNDNLSPGTFAKSLPPTPQHSPSSRKPSLVPTPSITVFDMITKNLESLPNDLSHLTTDYTLHIIEPLTGLSKQEDVMTVAKEASKSLYADLNPTERVDKINALLIKLRLILDNKTNTYTNSSALVKNASTEIPVDEHGPTLSPHKQAHVLGNSEECMQALSVIMLYLCTGLQHAQNVAAH